MARTLNILLLNPPTPDGSLFYRDGRCTQRSSIWSTQWPPISLAYLNALAIRGGHRASLVDAPVVGWTKDDLCKSVRAHPPDLVVASVATPSLVYDLAVLADLKAASPIARIAVIGVHATTEDRTILVENAHVDYAIRGEPEGVFSDVVERLACGGDVTGIAGLTHRDERGSIVREADRSPIADLDGLPFPLWSATDVRLYRLPFKRRPFLSLAPIRGCPYRCTFCTAGTYYGREARKRSPVSVTAEVRRNRDVYGVRDHFMWADTFTIDRDYVRELCAELRRETPWVRWTCNSRTDTVDAAALRAMRDAGCWMVSFGIESTDGEALRRARKKPRNDDFAAPIRWAREAGLITLGHFIIGLPGDTPESLRRSIEWAASSPLDFAQFYAAAPLVGSELYSEAVREGWIESRDYEAFAQDRPSLRLPGLSPDLVASFRRRAAWRFYLRPARALRLLALLRWGIVPQLASSFLGAWRRRPFQGMRRTRKGPAIIASSSEAT